MLPRNKYCSFASCLAKGGQLHACEDLSSDLRRQEAFALGGSAEG
jgi:hypothetical protein